MMFGRRTIDLETRAALAAFRRSPDGVLLLKGGAFIECNTAAENVYGLPRSSILGRNPVAFSTPTQGDGRASAEHVGERVQQAVRERYARFEWFNLRNNEPIRMLVTLIPLPEEGEDAMLVQIQDLAATAKVVETVTTGLARLAAGDLTVRLDTVFSSEFEPLRVSFNSAAMRMSTSVGSVVEVSGALYSGCGDIRQASDDLSSRTQRQASSLEETAAAMQEVTQTVRQTADMAMRIEKIITDTHRDAQSSTVVVDDATKAMAGIERASHEISDIISVIDGIAFQTNLLALNAGVEAARAGEAGRGFAVVASEVRALAQRSADAAKDVKTRITSSVQQVDRGVTLVSNTRDALGLIVSQMNQISSLIGEISTASRHQAGTLGQINIVVSEMDNMTQQNAAMVEETSAAVRKLAEHAKQLSHAANAFQVDDGKSATILRPTFERRDSIVVPS